MHGRVVRQKGADIEKVPELQHYEHGEEKALFVVGKQVVAGRFEDCRRTEAEQTSSFGGEVIVAQEVEHGYEHGCKEQPHSDDAAPHGGQNDGRRLLTRRFVHHAQRGRQ